MRLFQAALFILLAFVSVCSTDALQQPIVHPARESLFTNVTNRAAWRTCDSVCTESPYGPLPQLAMQYGDVP